MYAALEQYAALFGLLAGSVSIPGAVVGSLRYGAVTGVEIGCVCLGLATIGFLTSFFAFGRQIR